MKEGGVMFELSNGEKEKVMCSFCDSEINPNLEDIYYSENRVLCRDCFYIRVMFGLINFQEEEKND